MLHEEKYLKMQIIQNLNIDVSQNLSETKI